MKDKNFKEEIEKDSSLKEKKKLSVEDIKNLPLIDNDFFLFAIDNNKEFADVLIKPALEYLGEENYEIISVKSEVYYSNLKNHSVRIDCEVKLESGKRILIEIQNGHPEEMSLKRIRYQHGSVDTKFLNKGEKYNNLPDIISLVYTTEPLYGHDTGDTVNDFVFVDLKNNKIAHDFGIRVLVVNGKYKNEDSKNFSDIIEDLQKHNAEDVSNPVIKDIHLRTKNTEKGVTMFSDYIEERYGSIIRKYEEQNQKYQEQNQKYQEQHIKDQEQHIKDQKEIQNKDEIIQKYEKLMKEKGIIFE